MGIAAAVSLVEGAHDVIKSLFYNTWSVPGTAKWYNEGERFSTDVAVAAVAAGTGGTDPMVQVDAAQWEAVGRSADGVRCSWYMQGFAGPFTHNQRVFATDVSAVNDFLVVWNAMAADGLCTVSGARPVLKGYLNQVVNDYLTRQARRG
jgi:hypothetical protein